MINEFDDDYDEGEEYIQNELKRLRESQAKAEPSFNFNKEQARLTSKTRDAMEVIERDIWLANGAVNDPEMAELIVKAKLIENEPYTDIARYARDQHISGKTPLEIVEMVRSLPIINPTFRDLIQASEMDDTKKTAFKQFYKRQINEASLREVLEYASKRDYGYNPRAIVNILGKYHTLDISVPKKVSRMRSPEDVRRWLVNLAKREGKRLRSSYVQINLYTNGGLQLGSLYAFGGSTGVGKTIVMCWMCADFAMQGKSVLYVSTEMLEDQLYQRINRCMTDSDDDNEAGLKLEKIMMQENFIGYDVWCADELVSTVEDIEEMAPKGKYDVIIVDYGDKLAAGQKTENEYHRQGVIFTKLSRLAKKLDIPVIVATQQNREALKSPNGGMETVGDSLDKLRPLEMLFLIPYYDPQKRPDMRNKKNMNIKKNRNGVRDVDLFFDIDYDTWKLSEPQYVVDCIERNKGANPQEVFYRILDEQKTGKKEEKKAINKNDAEND